MSLSLDEFTAPRLLRNRHVQTLGAALPVWTRSDVPFEPMRIALPGDGGHLHAQAAWHLEGQRTAVVVVHGVGGSADSTYVQRAALALYAAGFHVVRLNLRGAGPSIPDVTALYHAGLTEDLAVTLAAVAKHEGVRDVALLGFSLGGNCSLRLAGLWGSAPPAYVRAVATVSAPLDLVETQRALERVRTLPYRAYVLRALIRQGWDFAKAHPSRATYEPRQLLRLRTIRAYDDLVIAPMHGFCDAHDYYVNASCGPGLADVGSPVLIVHAADDPMVPEDSVRPWIRDASSSVRVAWSERGGHVGWFADVSEGSWVKTWALERVIEFFRRPD
jgi:predicted alpha/beta-fold hydrolase